MGTSHGITGRRRHRRGFKKITSKTTVVFLRKIIKNYGHLFCVFINFGHFASRGRILAVHSLGTLMCS